MRRVLLFLIKLVVVVICFLAISVAFVIFDGLNDVGDKADAALVVEQGDSTQTDALLDHAVELYKGGKIHHIVIAVVGSFPAFSSQAAMTKYLEDHHVPSSAIIENSGAADYNVMAHDLAGVMQQRTMTSVMLISQYYGMTRLKLALLHAGVSNVVKSHVGTASFGDAWPIACEVGSLYQYIFRTFLMPAAVKVKDEASSAADKASQEAGKARDEVNKKLDSLPK
jgi:uncharacterized SAM-binding protein YcdF (DUF218 family)